MAKVRQLLQSVRTQPEDLIILPEMCLTGFSLNPAVTAQPPGGPNERFLAKLAAQHQCAVVGGVVSASGEAGMARNEAVAFAPDSSELARYTKRQPFSPGGENKVHAAGKDAAVFDWAGARIGLMICYDLRFPEIAREAVMQGAELLINIACWPVARVEHWLTLLRARAIENQAWVAGINRCGRDPHFTYPGRSVIVDPQGVIAADAGDREQVMSVNCDLEAARQWRRDFPALRDAGILPAT